MKTVRIKMQAPFAFLCGKCHCLVIHSPDSEKFSLFWPSLKSTVEVEALAFGR